MAINNNIDKIFQKGLDDYSPKPPGFVWDNIQSGLKKQNNKRQKHIIYSIAASVTILLAFGAGYYTHIFSPSKANGVANAPHTNEITVEDNASDINSSSLRELKNDVEIQSIQNSEGGSKYENNNRIFGNEPEIEDTKSNPNKPIDADKTKESKIKRVKSEGVLLSPSFASEGKVVKANENKDSTENGNQFNDCQTP